MSNILVTGGCGFIGSNLVDKLIFLGHNVHIVDNLTTGRLENLNPKAKFIHADIRNLDLPWEIDTIFHLAALPRIQPSFIDPAETVSVNCSGTIQVLEYAKRTKAKVIYAGSSSFYFDPHMNPYAHSKWIGEEHCRMYNKSFGLSTAIARFFNVYGPRHSREGDYCCVLGIFEKQYLNRRPFTVVGTGEQRRDFTHVKDIVEGLIQISLKEWNGETFNLGRGANHSVNEVVEMFKPDEVKYLPARPGEAIATLADLEETKQKLSWEPIHELKDYVQDFIDSNKYVIFDADEFLEPFDKGRHKVNLTRGKCCFIIENDPLLTRIKKRFLIEGNVCLKVFMDSTSDVTLENYYWGDAPTEKMLESAIEGRKVSKLLDSIEAQKFLYTKGLAPKYFHTVFLARRGKLYPAQIVEFISSDRVTTYEERCAALNKIDLVCNNSPFAMANFKLISELDIIKGKIVDFQGFQRKHDTQ